MPAKRLHMPDPTAAMTDEVIVANLDRGSRVVDLGCGDARLLSRLETEQQCRVLGVERDHDLFLAGLGRGIPMLRTDLDKGLSDIPDGAFDFAVISQTLQQVQRPLDVLDEILRIARRALVVVPNFGHWRVRLQIVLSGRAPVTDCLPYQWYASPNVHVLTMLDFRDLAKEGNFRIVKELPIIGTRAVDRAWLANLRAHSALFVLERAGE